jgi:prepilin-type processing-associated H-X9-DG protein
MVRLTCLAVAAMMCTSLAYAAPAPAAPAPAAAAPVAKAADLAAYVPSGAFYAGRVRVAQLVGSDLWKKLAGPDGINFQEMQKEGPFKLDIEKDVKEAVFAVSVTFEGNEPQKPSFGVVLLTNRDIDPADLFKKEPEKIQLPGAAVAAYRVGTDTFFACPTPRTVVIATTPEFLAEMLTSAAGAAKADKDAAWLKALDQPGELVLVARMPDEAREALENALFMGRRQMVSQSREPEVIGFGVGVGFVMRLATEFQSVVLSMDLSRKEDALRITFTFATENGAAFIGSGLALLEPSLTEALAMMQAPPAVGGPPPAPGAAPPAASAPAPAAAPAAASPPEPVYLAVFLGKEARVTMSRAGVDRLVIGLIVPAFTRGVARSGAVSSANNLRQLGMACQAWAAANHQKFPDNWKQLLDTGLIENAEVLKNPSLAEHYPDGDYVLVPVPSVASSPISVLAYERYPDGKIPADGINVLFIDGHVEHMTAEGFQKALDATLEEMKKRAPPPATPEP